MFENLTPFLVVGLVMLAIGLVAFVGVYPFLTGEYKSEKRFDAVMGAKSNRVRSRVDSVANRRKMVQEQLKHAEQKRAAKNKVTLRTRLIRAGLRTTPQQFHMACVVMAMVGFVFAYVGGINLGVAIMIGFATGMGLPRWVIKFLAKRRQAKFSEEFANSIDIIVRGVKTGLPLNECLNIIARESPEPVKGEFTDFVEGQRLGIPMAECFDRMLDSMPLPEVNFFSIVVSIQQGSGGNLAEALGNLSGVIRARKLLVAKVHALASEAKASAAILGGLPFVVMGMVYATSPSYINLLFEEKLGHVLLAVAAALMTCGIVVMRQMINFKY